jgi:hypothetical protein
MLRGIAGNGAIWTGKDAVAERAGENAVRGDEQGPQDAWQLVKQFWKNGNLGIWSIKKKLFQVGQGWRLDIRRQKIFTDFRRQVQDWAHGGCRWTEQINEAKEYKTMGYRVHGHAMQLGHIPNIPIRASTAGGGHQHG